MLSFRFSSLLVLILLFVAIDGYPAGSDTEAEGASQDSTSSEFLTDNDFDLFEDIWDDLDDSGNWLTIPSYDYCGRGLIVQMSKPEDQPCFSNSRQVSPGSSQNPHRLIRESTNMLGFAMIHGFPLRIAGFGFGGALYHRWDKVCETTASSYEEAFYGKPPSIPKSFDDILNWPDHTVMYFGSQNFGFLIGVVGVLFNGIDARVLVKKGITVKIEKADQKIIISFIARTSSGGRAGYFGGPFSVGYQGKLRHQVTRHCFLFSLHSPSQQLRLACKNILAGDLKLALSLASEPESGIQTYLQSIDMESENLKRFSVGLPLIVRFSNAQREKHFKGTVDLNGFSYLRNLYVFDKKIRYRRLRMKKKGSSEPFLIHKHKTFQEQAIGFFDLAPNGTYQIGSKISYHYEFDLISTEDFSKQINSLRYKVFSDEIQVEFPSETPKGAMILHLDIILPQEEIEALSWIIHDDPKLFLDQRTSCLKKFLANDKTKFNPCYEIGKDRISPKWKKVLKKSVSKLTELAGVLAPLDGRRLIERLQEDQDEGTKLLAQIAEFFRDEPLLFFACKPIRKHLFRFNYELQGEFIGPFCKEF